MNPLIVIINRQHNLWEKESRFIEKGLAPFRSNSAPLVYNEDIGSSVELISEKAGDDSGYTYFKPCEDLYWDGLSFFVKKEMEDLCFDENFWRDSDKILNKFDAVNQEEKVKEDTEILYNISEDSFNCYTNKSGDNVDQKKLNQDDIPDEVFKINSESHYNVLQKYDDEEENINPNNKEEVIIIKNTNESLLPEHVEWETENLIKKTKNRFIRVDPKELHSTAEYRNFTFTSLKRKDVIFKSILRMMRRYFCKMLEINTSYNRKEKSIFNKHKCLIKSIKEVVDKSDFSDFSSNMPFYFGCFAYPSDLRKILEEAKQQYRTQNEMLSKAWFIVQLVDNAFNRFSKKVFNDLLGIPEISFLVHYYISNCQEDILDTRYFKPWYEMLETQAGESLDLLMSGKPNPNTRDEFIFQEEFFLFQECQKH